MDAESANYDHSLSVNKEDDSTETAGSPYSESDIIKSVPSGTRTPRINQRPASGAFTPRRGNQQMVQLIQSETNPFQLQEAETDTIVIRAENLTDAKEIKKDELKQILDTLAPIESNEAILWTLGELKTPYLFTSDSLLQILEVTTSIKTKLTIIAIIGPRLTDPRAKINQFVEMFRFSEEKDKVSEILKARGTAIDKAVFKQAPASLMTAGRGTGRGGAGRGAGRRDSGMVATTHSPTKPAAFTSAPTLAPSLPAAEVPPPYEATSKSSSFYESKSASEKADSNSSSTGPTASARITEIFSDVPVVAETGSDRSDFNCASQSLTDSTSPLVSVTQSAPNSTSPPVSESSTPSASALNLLKGLTTRQKFVDRPRSSFLAAVATQNRSPYSTAVPASTQSTSSGKNFSLHRPPSLANLRGKDHSPALSSNCSSPTRSRGSRRPSGSTQAIDNLAVENLDEYHTPRDGENYTPRSSMSGSMPNRNTILQRDEDLDQQPRSRYAKATIETKKVEIIGSRLGVNNIRQLFLNNGSSAPPSPAAGRISPSRQASIDISEVKSKESQMVADISRVATAVDLSPKDFLSLDKEESLGKNETGLTVYSYRELVRQNHCKEYGEITPGQLERHLTKEEFEKYFKMNQEQFDKLAKWRKHELKKSLFLF